MINAKIGIEAIEFDVHKDLLCHCSSYFRQALNSDFKEGIENEVVLEEDDQAISRIFVHFLYTDKLYENVEVLDSGDKDARMILQQQFTEVWLLGDMRGIPALQNAATDAIHQIVCCVSSTSDSAIALVYERPATAGPLRSLFVEYHVQCGISPAYALMRPRPAIDFFIESMRQVQRLHVSGWRK